MPNKTPSLRLLAAVLIATSASAGTRDTDTAQAVFMNPNGVVIEVSTAAGFRNCSDEFQYCLTNDKGFAFSWFRKCMDMAAEGALDRIKFGPRIVSIDHHHDAIWLVFDAAPGYLFHYVDGRGIVGINVGETPQHDFRALLKKGVSLHQVETQYEILSGNAIAACE